ncbi:MAG: GyrI-like domain-containing protein [Methanotrichaceae archaeon]|nr:GyrI-like domain-containing protein [Methanotrichaceae archaeon]
MSEPKIAIKNVGEMKVASLQYKGLPFQETVPRAFGELMKWMKQKGLSMLPGSPWGLTLYYDDPKAVASEDVRFKVAVPVPEDAPILADGLAQVETIPPYRAAYLTVRGSYENLEAVYQRLAAWVYQNGYLISDAPREVMIKWSENMPPEDWVTEIHFPIEPQ